MTASCVFAPVQLRTSGIEGLFDALYSVGSAMDSSTAGVPQNTFNELVSMAARTYVDEYSEDTGPIEDLEEMEVRTLKRIAQQAA